MATCPKCKTHWRELPDEEGDHECPKCGESHDSDEMLLDTTEL